jgi:GT2 family glycosyltransferase
MTIGAAATSLRVKTCAIGVRVHAEPYRLLATLASLRANTTFGAKVYLLCDDDDATCGSLSRLGDLPRLATGGTVGGPACFNLLATATDTDVVVLLESGAVVGPDWLDHLLAALATDPRNGLAGPSTNRAWNEQGAFPRAGGTPADIARTSSEAERRFGVGLCRPLEPLYSLADFCYAVRRVVIAAIGAADEDYGRGPCWEMDYNIRAARAGWRGVWACAAYVYRPPVSPRRAREESRAFAASKRRYQEKFCGLRLRGDTSGFEPHCQGDACEHFAPRGLIQVHRSLLPPTATAPLPIVRPLGEPPLVSCVMPTRNRREFALQAIRYFQRQDYPARELIILDDGDEDLTPLLPMDRAIHYVRLTPQSLGAKRNLGCELARGTLIAQWDDDDWYAPTRLTLQAAPLLAGHADITGLTARRFFELDRWRFWTCTPQLHRRLFAFDVAAGTLMYHRRVWQSMAQYPNRSLAEDAAFLRQAVRRGARLVQLAGEDCFAYVRHGANSWVFSCGRSFNPLDWSQIAEPPLPPTDRAFYVARSTASSKPQPTGPKPRGRGAMTGALPAR